MDTKIGNFKVLWSIAVLKFLKESLSSNFHLIAVFVKVALEITKTAQHCVLPRFTRFRVFRNRASDLRSADCRVYKGHLQNEWVIKTFRKYPKRAKLVCIKSSLQLMHNLYPFLEIDQDISKLLSYISVKLRKTEDLSTQNMRSVKHF